MRQVTEKHIGDGLYASCDGWMVKLRAPREHGDHWVGLEDWVLDAFLRWLKQNEIVR